MGDCAGAGPVFICLLNGRMICLVGVHCACKTVYKEIMLVNSREKIYYMKYDEHENAGRDKLLNEKFI